MKGLFCMWCGVEANQDQGLLDEQGQWRCPSCLKQNAPSEPEETVQICAACQAPFAASAHYCPDCGRKSEVSPPPVLQEMGLRPSPAQPIWPCKGWHQEDGRGLQAPGCPQCGQPLRPPQSGEHHHFGIACPPWNAGWNGQCASCGWHVEVVVEQQTHFDSRRSVRISPTEHFHQTFIDEGMVFSGVEIEVSEKQYYDREPVTSKVFLSMGELMALVRALDREGKVWQQQMDWSCDWT